MQCFSYTEAEVASSSPDLTFSKKCQTTPTLDKYEDRFTKVTYTKYKETSEIFLSSPVYRAHFTHQISLHVKLILLLNHAHVKFSIFILCVFNGHMIQRMNF